MAPSNFNNDWKLAATPEAPDPTNPPSLESAKINAEHSELCGIRGVSLVDTVTDYSQLPTSNTCATGPVRTAFQVSTGRPDVVIAVLDSGIKWNDKGAMTALRKKVHLNQGELPAPRIDRTNATRLDPSVNCDLLRAQGVQATGGDYNPKGNYDVNGDGVFNVLDYACDSRVNLTDSRRHGPPGVLTPEDLILAFSDGIDHDHNGYANDIAGWDFVDNTNNPYDDVQYGHGTGEARDSNGEANTSEQLGTCPNCMVMPLRVGESFIADVNRFAQASLYAVDSGVYVIQEALGTINNSNLARDAIQYAYRHGVAVIASAADEAAEHHNQPGALPDTIVVNSVRQYDQTFTPSPRSYLQVNGCTNFSTKIAVSVPSSSCSSEATGKSAGIAGLIYSAALNARDAGTLASSRDCTRVDGSPCVITANEVRQLMASGNVGGTQPADAGNGGQADDVNFEAAVPNKSCTPSPSPACTDPNSFTFSPEQPPNGVVVSEVPTRRYPARKGFDEFYGYGRLNAYNAVHAAGQGIIPPEAEITSPDWFQQIDPGQGTVALDGHVSARAPFTCRIDVGPGGEPNNALTTDNPPGDFKTVHSSFCDGATIHTGAHDGRLAELDLRDLKSRFPASSVGAFNGREAGLAGSQTANGRPNTMPYAFTVRVVVTTAQGTPMTGEDRRQMFLHRDQDMLNQHWPIELGTDGASAPLLADITGTNTNQLFVATSDGLIHAYRPDGTELPGWPVHTDPLPLHAGERAFAVREVSPAHYGAVLGALAAGDLFHDGRLEVVADDVEGKVYAWDASGHLVFRQEANLAYSGRPLTPFVNVRKGPRDRTDHSFYAGPVLADLTGSGKELDIIAAGTDRHVYAWHPNGQPVAGFPVEVYDPSKVTTVDPVTHHLTFGPNAGSAEDQGKLVDTPAVAKLHSSDPAPSIIVGSNEEYVQNSGDEGPINASSVSNASLGVIGPLGLLTFGNSRLYAIKSDGNLSGHPFLPGWPKKVGLIDVGLLPDVGEGITGSPVVAPTTCSNGGGGPKIGVIPDAGPGYLFNPDGSSCYGSSNGQDNALPTDTGSGRGQVDRPVFPAVGEPAFGNIGGQLDFVAPVAGLTRAVDVAAPEYQGGQDFISAWDTQTGQFHSGFPSPVNDLQFVTGPSVADILGQPGEEAVGGTASLDLAAIDGSGSAASSKWPKLTGDWTIANPTIGSLGTNDTQPSAHKVVVSITRSGTLAVYSTSAPACSPSSWPRFHHDIANSGDYTRDAVPPGRPVIIAKRNGVLSFTAPGNDLMCGTVAEYQVVSSNAPIRAENFAAARPVPGAPRPGSPGTHQSMTLPAGTGAYVAIRAVGQQGNLGRPGVIGPGCSSQPPRSTINHRIGRRRHRLRLRGRATGGGCPAGVNAVRVSIARRTSQNRCRFVTSRGRLTPPGACNSPVYLNARLHRVRARSRRGRRRSVATVSWTLTLRHRPPRGHYRVATQAVATDGTAEAVGRRANRLIFRLR